MSLIPFKADHLTTIRMQSIQSIELGDVAQAGPELEAAGPAYTMLKDGLPVICAGIAPVSAGRAVAWAVLAAEIGCAFIPAHRAVKKFLDAQTFRRIETYVQSDFPEGHRWALMLGFEFEGRMGAFFDDGRDGDLFARVK